MPLPQTFKAMVVSETADQKFIREIRQRELSDLPAGELLIEVKYSSLNYKDALSASGNKGVTRKYPHTPGIDAAGVRHQLDFAVWGWRAGDRHRVRSGCEYPGGFGQYISVPAAWAVKLPQGLTLKESMGYGTGGLTAALCVLRLMAFGLTKDSGKFSLRARPGGRECRRRHSFKARL